MSVTDAKDVSTSVVIENGFIGPIVGRFWGHIGDARDIANPNPLQVALPMRFIEVVVVVRGRRGGWWSSVVVLWWL